MRCSERMPKEVGRGRECVLQCTLVIVDVSSCSLDLPHTSVILHPIPLDEIFDTNLYNQHSSWETVSSL
jgi:hypothetical protein